MQTRLKLIYRLKMAAVLIAAGKVIKKVLDRLYIQFTEYFGPGGTYSLDKTHRDIAYGLFFSIDVLGQLCYYYTPINKEKTMSKVCDICGKGKLAGMSIKRRGMAKKDGGVGRKITGRSIRRFSPNLQKVKVNMKGVIKTIKVCTSCIRSGKIVKA